MLVTVTADRLSRVEGCPIGMCGIDTSFDVLH